MLGIYVHIPFCRQKCLYCDFPSYAGLERCYADYVAALCREIDASPYQGKVDSVYFGGGTPSLLPPGATQEILAHVQKKFQLMADTEITLEANPDSLDETKARELRQAGINRLSLGIQSFNDDLLLFLKRLHTAAEGKNAVLAAYEAGFRNLSIDLMYGLPGQTLEDIDCDLLILDELPVIHASIYSLIVEEGTQLKAGLAQGRWKLPDEEMVTAQAHHVHAQMAAYGFEHYEISSYAKPGFASRHNTKYWTYEPYLGFGASAHSFMADKRWANLANIPQYLEKAGRESVIAEQVIITEKRAVEDYCFLALRRRQGIDYADFQRRFGHPITADFASVIKHLVKQGLLEETTTGCRLTLLGLAYGNYVFSQFIRG